MANLLCSAAPLQLENGNEVALRSWVDASFGSHLKYAKFVIT